MTGCKYCKFWDETDSGWGFCKRHAPVPIAGVDADHNVWEWPHTGWEDRCGDGEDKPTWDELCLIEPRLQHVEDFAEEAGVDQSYRNYESAKTQLSRLVGRDAQNPLLRSSEAWDVALAHLTPLVCP